MCYVHVYVVYLKLLVVIAILFIEYICNGQVGPTRIVTSISFLRVRLLKTLQQIYVNKTRWLTAAADTVISK